jgi:uncharacterized membrane protein YccC
MRLQVSGWITRHRPELRLAVRVTVSSVFAFLLAWLLALPQGFWAVITAVMVMQASLGGSIKAAIDRFIGTLGGAVVGAAVAIVVPHANVWGLVLALACAVAPLSFAAALNPSFRVAPITALIVLLPTSTQQLGPIEAAIDRVLEIALGDVVGVCVALFVLPSRAHAVVTEIGAEIVALFAQLIQALLDTLDPSADRPSVLALQAKARSLLKQLEAAADEAVRERRSRLTEQPDPEPFVRTVYRVRHDLVMLGRSTSTPLASGITSRLQPPLKDVARSAGDLLARMAEGLRSGTLSIDLKPLETALDAINAEIAAIRSERLTQTMDSDAVAGLFALGFALGQLRQDLRDLSERVVELSRGARSGA